MTPAPKPGNSFLNPPRILKTIGVKHGSTVADFGCGGGFFVLDASRIVGDDGTAYGVDVQKNALSYLESKVRLYGMSNVKTVWSNVEIYNGAKSIPNGTVDFVLMVQLLSQTDKHQEVFREAARVLDKDGSIAVIDWLEKGGDFGPAPEHRVSAQAVKDLANEAGFKLVREIDVGYFHYGLIFKRA